MTKWSKTDQQHGHGINTFFYAENIQIHFCALEQSTTTRKSMGQGEMGQHINLMADAKATAREDIYSEGVQ